MKRFNLVVGKYLRRIFFTSILLLGLLVRRVHTISCFQCDSLEKEKSDCPGFDRLPVHSVTHLGDKNGFYTHCLDVRLADDTIIHQDVIPFRPTCKKDFIKIWKASLESQFKTNVTITCCGSNSCNGPGMITDAKSHCTTVKESLINLCLLWTILLCAKQQNCVIEI